MGLYKHLTKQGYHCCHEVTLPYSPQFEIYNQGIVDTVLFHKARNQQGVFRFYEIKISVSDFHSKNGHNFSGNFNYYVMPMEIYEKVKNEIPKFVGCLVARKYISHRTQKEETTFDCAKKPKQQELKCDYTEMMAQMIKALAREDCKAKLGYVKLR